jgi:DNA-binding beta-propeller fold protein YncE
MKERDLTAFLRSDKVRLMRKCLFFLLAVSTVSAMAGDAPLKRYLYLSTPDAAQSGGSGNGVLVFDIDNGHRFVRRIDIPFKEGLRGFCGNANNHAVYYSSTSRRLGAFDLETEKVFWERTYDAGIDRACVTPDGKKLYAPTGWWYRGTNSGFLVINPRTGDVINRLAAGPQAHNSIASLDGRFVYLGTETNFWVFGTSDDSLLHHVQGVGESGVFPFTVDSRNRTAYICLGKHVGFDLIDLTSGKITHRVFAGDEPIPHRTHGAALTPDEQELWISDQDGKRLFIFDATQLPPKAKGQVELTESGHGWVCFSLDGRYAWCHTPDVIDVQTRQIVATLKDDKGKPVSGSKFLEIHFRNGKVVAMGDQFGLGRAHLTPKLAYP